LPRTGDMLNAFFDFAAPLCAFLAIFAPACTTNETGSIDLAGSAMPPPMPPMKPPPMPPDPKKMGCATDMDCQGPKSRCDIAAAQCVECSSELDCTDPMRPFCEQDAAKCVECTNDSVCGPGGKCGPDSTCKP
jgi:hypothetical protein